MGHRGISLDDLDEVVSESGIVASELICECGEDVLERLSVRVITGTEEACAEEVVIAGHF